MDNSQGLNVRPDRLPLDGKNDGPVPNVFASTAGRAVSRRS